MEIKYDNIGEGYNSTRRVDPYLLSRLLYFLKPHSDNLYIDLGCGTGNYTSALASEGLRFIGIDPSERMLNEAKKKSQKVVWLNGSAETIPLEDKSVNGIIATLTIHHWKDLKKAFLEIHRVLKEQGQFVIFTSSPEQMKGYWLNHYFPEMLQDSIVQMPTLNLILKAAENTQLKICNVEKYCVKDDLQDCFLYVGKNKPEYYFNEQIRHGISSFSALANRTEVEKGLSKLKEDMDKQIFEQVQRSYENDLGDYLFIVIEKK